MPLSKIKLSKLRERPKFKNKKLKESKPKRHNWLLLRLKRLQNLLQLKLKDKQKFKLSKKLN